MGGGISPAHATLHTRAQVHKYGRPHLLRTSHCSVVPPSARSDQLALAGSRWLLIFLFCKNLVKVHSALVRTFRKSPSQWECAVLIQLTASLSCHSEREVAFPGLTTDPVPTPHTAGLREGCGRGEWSGGQALPLSLAVPHLGSLWLCL